MTITYVRTLYLHSTNVQYINVTYEFIGTVQYLQGRRVIRAWGAWAPQIKLSLAKINDTLYTVQCSSPPNKIGQNWTEP